MPSLDSLNGDGANVSPTSADEVAAVGRRPADEGLLVDTLWHPFLVSPGLTGSTYPDPILVNPKICSTKGMAVATMRFEYAVKPAPRILLRCDGLDMRRINAQTYTTEMIPFQIKINWDQITMRTNCPPV